ncbi:TetR/AcrR family transcriptional regulator [Halosquirtibacter xylanolyticus]|uniref:TetR/AcrR family transcriptional regulator n=1 Tax=Halosquirtibacter xylanolyticus TaxID=3374599 RepID=UPI0037485796|nr:TetR/AcrR family transcriptional regulator [Prolixibacteraceae bacterium]
MDKRKQIIDSATKLFSEQGFENTSISAICKMANVSNGLVFHHFKNKNELLREIFSSTTGIVVKMIEEYEEQSEGMDPKVRLRQHIERIFHQMEEDKEFFQLYLSVMFYPTTRLILIDLIEERSDILLGFAERLLKGVHHEKSSILKYMFTSELDGIAINYIYKTDEYPLETVKEQMIQRYTS